ncbi:MAG: hypothetical protein KGY80_11420 [Candidatus Thorarchaeota archaeon]|nr:hypothetical protein [Candidatus Thorarchaeota archaeon]
MKEDKQTPQEEAEEIREIFSALNESIPKLISGLVNSVYSPEAAAKMAEAIGGFYSKLKEQGLPDEVALKMTKQYASALDFGKIMDMAQQGEEIDISAEIEE